MHGGLLPYLSQLPGLEQYCDNELTLTYNSPDPYGVGVTYGGYSEQIVVNENFVLRVSESLDPARVAPSMIRPVDRPVPSVHTAHTAATAAQGEGRPDNRGKADLALALHGLL
jgi:hypothetical protein